MRATMIAFLISTGAVQAVNMRPFFDAVRQVESGGNPNAVGDGGASLGPYQIQRAYWRDSGVPGRYEQVRDRAYAERVMLGYFKRYCPDALKRGDWQTLARTHNGGLAGPRKAATLKYWAKVRRAMKQ
jgi:hypothetical protein